VGYKSHFPSSSGYCNLDAAATGLLPGSVAAFIFYYHLKSCANAGRSAYRRSIDVTGMVDEAREKIALFLGTGKNNLAFVPGATHAINWGAKGLGLSHGDTILCTMADHHANILPWLDLKKIGTRVVFAACDVLGRIDLEDFERKARGARVAAFVAASNVTGGIQPIRELAGICSRNGVISVVDAAQLAPHQRIDFDSLGVDFMAIAGHKMMASKGAGLLLAKESAQPLIRPLIVGGGSIKDVATDSFELLPFPEGFESGTPSIEGILSLWKAIEWLQEQGENDVWLHEGTLNRQARDAISQVRGLMIYQPENSTPTMSVELSGWEPNKLAIKLDREFNIAVRSGHMCALPLVRDTMGFPKGLCRISFGPWNEMEDVFSIAGALDKISREKTCW